mmetsp:Transcript_16250/g.51670  ORF Transcript_16250/g.51670 Transcript_16250/m.51670 type:complete len:289 (-) Transcript_16250:775-1641(-)
MPPSKRVHLVAIQAHTREGVVEGLHQGRGPGHANAKRAGHSKLAHAVDDTVHHGFHQRPVLIRDVLVALLEPRFCQNPEHIQPPSRVSRGQCLVQLGVAAEVGQHAQLDLLVVCREKDVAWCSHERIAHRHTLLRSRAAVLSTRQPDGGCQSKHSIRRKQELTNGRDRSFVDDPRSSGGHLCLRSGPGGTPCPTQHHACHANRLGPLWRVPAAARRPVLRHRHALHRLGACTLRGIGGPAQGGAVWDERVGHTGAEMNPHQPSSAVRQPIPCPRIPAIIIVTVTAASR